jgi:hypothetical protein
MPAASGSILSTTNGRAASAASAQLRIRVIVVFIVLTD